MFRLALLTSFSLVLAAGCQKDDSSTAEALKRIDDRLSSIESKVDKAATARPSAGAQAAGRNARPPGPDPSKVYSVSIDGAPFVGAADAKVTVVKAFEFACPFCVRVTPTLDALLEQYQGEIKVVYKHLLVHPQQATVPALASCAADAQGKFKAMYDGIWEKGFKQGRQLGKEKMVEIAQEIGLDMARFEKDLAGEGCKKRLATDQQELRRVGARGTPAFFINGRYLSGARPIDQFKKIIDEELAKANARLRKGEKLATYYAENVVKKGKKSL